MNVTLPELTFEPDRWMLLFHRTARTHLVNLLVPGKFKHVTACGLVRLADVWVIYSVELVQTRIYAIPDKVFREWLTEVVADCEILVVTPTPVDGRVFRLRAGFWCVTAVKHLLGLRSGALRPDTLWRHLLANGAEQVIDDGKLSQAGGQRRPECEAAAS